jgi:hypothetical protein
MATERQIAANRRNAVKSTGPRSSAGKRRARRNSYRHGLSVAATGSPEQVEKLARKIAGAGADAMVLEQARTVAQAQLDLTQIRRMRASLIQRMSEFGVLDTPDPLGTFRDIKRILNSIDRGFAMGFISPSSAKHAFIRAGPHSRSREEGLAGTTQARPIRAKCYRPPR